MESFVELPNLPKGRLKSLIVGEGCPENLLSSLESLGVSVLLCPKNPRVDSRLSGHADLSVFHLGGKSFLLAKTLKNSAFAEKLLALGADLLFSETEQANIYPHDASLCALSMGGRVFHNKKLTDKEIFFKSPLFHDVRQGYAKCAVCPVSENAAISSDMGMIPVMKNCGIDVLELSSGGVCLTGFAEGFIGGAAFKLSRDVIAFTGSLSSLPDREKLLRFLEKQELRPVFLSGGELIDLGSFIPLTEET
ncbi:MAG: hypothetical protein GX025_04470 [Clostridiales bacterium]|nr:hypothetical protein [Clostridiales bacterium]